MKDIECPYCGKELDINHDDGYGYTEDEVFQQECGHCNKTFVYTTNIIFTYNAEKADCLNDGKHDYQPTTTYPKEASRMRCTMCDHVRNATKEEREKYGFDK